MAPNAGVLHSVESAVELVLEGERQRYGIAESLKSVRPLQMRKARLCPHNMQQAINNVYGATRLKCGVHPLLFLLFLMATLLPLSAVAQWIPIGPEGGPVYCFAVIDSTLLAGNEAGLAQSNDGGASWTAFPTGQSHRFPNGAPVSALLVYEDTLFAGGGRYVRSGGTWTPSVTNGGSVQPLARSANNLMGTTQSSGLTVSTDGGFTWSGIANPLMDTVGTEGGGTRIQIAPIYAVAANAGSFFICSDHGIFTTQDNGTTWNWLSDEPGNQGATSLLFIGDTVFATTTQGVFASFDGCVTWNARSSGLSNLLVHALYRNHTQMFAATRQGIDVSVDNGDSWSSASNGLPGTDVYAIQALSGKLFAGTTDGVYYSTNGGLDWLQANHGLTIASVNSLVRAGGTLFCSADYRPWRSTDNGATWHRADAGLGFNYVEHLPSIQGVLFALSGDGLFRSTDGGTNWTPLPTRPQYITSVGGDLVGASRDTIFLSTDTGATWSVRSLLPTDLWYTVCSLCTNGRNIYAGTYHEGPLLSTDEGLTWNPVPNWPSFPLHDQISAIVGYGSTMIIHTNSYLYYSSDSGLTWIWDTSHTFDYRYPRAFFVSGDTVLAGGGGLFLSDMSGANWFDITAGLTYATIESVLLDGPNVIIGTALGGAWRRQLNELMGVSESGNEPSPRTLSCYPNPCVDEATIDFTLQTAVHVTLTLEDAAGRSVLLSNGQYLPAGQHSIEWDSRHFPAGVYLCRLTLPLSSETCKVVLLK